VTSSLSAAERRIDEHLYRLSYEVLATETGVSIRTARRVIRDLERRGFITRIGRGGWRVNIETLEAAPKIPRTCECCRER
jgi:DNA-binding GntR family transcriptional regulator